MRNPTRRSRKIGLTQGGRVQDGRPWEKWSRVFPRDIWQALSEGATGREVFVENPSRDFFHPCKPAEVHGVMARLPEELVSPVAAVVFRRTPELDYRLGIDARKRYSCIILNSFPASLELSWDSKPSAGTVRHFEPWCRDWSQTSDGWVLKWTLAQVRRYYLYHLLLHEIGHFHQPWSVSVRLRENFAENFALQWARTLGELQ